MLGQAPARSPAAIAKKAPSSRIVGIDPAAPYVALAQSQQGSALIQFEVGDASRCASTMRSSTGHCRSWSSTSSPTHARHCAK
jgi:hypothetical protein